MSGTAISKIMPTMSGGTADRDSSFVMGRRAFFNHNSVSHNANNVNKNIDYSSVKGTKSSIVYGKPLNDKSGNLRIQRLRLSAVGGGSSKLKNANDSVNFNRTTPDVNFQTHVLSRVRGGGTVAHKKGVPRSKCCS